MKIAIIGLGYVALTDALMFARHHKVMLTAPLPDRVEAIASGRFDFAGAGVCDPDLSTFLARETLDLGATVETARALEGADMVFISLPLGFDAENGEVPVHELSSRVALAHDLCPGVPIIVRSALPHGETERLRVQHNSHNIVFVPEFFDRRAPLQSALAPELIVIGARGSVGRRIADLFANSLAANANEVPIHLIGSGEAEAVKKFAQAALATRVGFFNGLDSFAMQHDLDSRRLIGAVASDQRVGRYAINPCLGFNGSVCETGLSAGQAAPTRDETGVFTPEAQGIAPERLDFLAEQVIARAPRRVGLYRQTPAGAGPNLPLHALQQKLLQSGLDVTCFDETETKDPILRAAAFERFKKGCDLVVAQRMTSELADISTKLFSRDLFPRG